VRLIREEMELRKTLRKQAEGRASAVLARCQGMLVGKEPEVRAFMEARLKAEDGERPDARCGVRHPSRRDGSWPRETGRPIRLLYIHDGPDSILIEAVVRTSVDAPAAFDVGLRQAMGAAAGKV